MPVVSKQAKIDKNMWLESKLDTCMNIYNF